jgi:1,4-alpha-glucan branching enzyme
MLGRVRAAESRGQGAGVIKVSKTKAGTRKVTFTLPLSETPEPVSVCGDFNGWDPLQHPLKKRANQTRSVSVEVDPGRYAFKYLSDGGTWFTDPEADSHEANEYGETNSIIEV